LGLFYKKDHVCGFSVFAFKSNFYLTSDFYR
jgi:hypothetical protein